MAPRPRVMKGPILMAVPKQFVDATALPQKTTHRFGLKSVARSEQKSNGHWMFGSQWLESCGENVKVAPDNCAPDITEEEMTKIAFGQEAGATEQFTLYGLHQCSVVGSAISERSGLAMEELNLGEWFQIEKHLMDVIAADGTEVNAGGVGGAFEALGVILQAWGLGVEPTVHMTPNVAVALRSSVQRQGAHLELRTGEPVAVGHGYVTGLPNLSVGRIALTGPTMVEYGSAIENEQIDVPTNSYLALAERPYTLGYTCKAIYIDVLNLADLIP